MKYTQCIYEADLYRSFPTAVLSFPTGQKWEKPTEKGDNVKKKLCENYRIVMAKILVILITKYSTVYVNMVYLTLILQLGIKKVVLHVLLESNMFRNCSAPPLLSFSCAPSSTRLMGVLSPCTQCRLLATRWQTCYAPPPPPVGPLLSLGLSLMACGGWCL